ncbi:MAG: LysR substrate-binding domain-containing protein [Bacteroidales bacterium]|nr:LysR substrate-binding domain-containing protein [Bacteroidales bacterium]
MELRQLKYFCQVAESGSFSEAASDLNVSQSTLSQQIRQLESEIGGELFVRDTRHVHLTDVGQALLPSARRTLSEAASCITRMRDVMQLQAGEISIGCTYTFAPMLRDTVLAFMKQYPGVKLNIHCHSVEKLMEMLEHEKIDVALSYKPTTSYPNIESHIIFDNRLAVIVNDTHVLAAQKSITLADLEKYPLILPAKGLMARTIFDRMTEALDREFDVKLEINDVSVLISLVRNSKLVTVLSSATVSHKTGVVAIPLHGRGTEMQGAFNFRTGSYMKGATKEFLRILCENRSLQMALMEIF